MKETFNLRDKVWGAASKETKKSWAWYEQHVRAAAGRMSAQQFLGDNIAHQVHKSAVSPGDMISFFYSPKHKETLPIYDTFPLVLPFSVSADGKSFTGLNLHYLKPVVRATLLDTLMQYANDDKLKAGAKIHASWSMLKSAAGTGIAEHCVKQYLFTHVKSQVLIIPPPEWEYVIFLPLERFTSKVGLASNEAAWKPR